LLNAVAAGALGVVWSGAGSGSDRGLNEAHAQARSPDAKKRAAARFREAEALFQKHQYPEAALAFEEAYATAPHPSVLLNAINAWALASEPVRAANLATQLLADPASDEKSRDEARGRLVEARRKIGRLELRGEGLTSLTVDGQPTTLGEIFVTPGDHLLAALAGGQPIQRKVTVVAGGSEQILLEASPAPAPAASAPVASTAAPEPTGLAPTWAWVGAGVTLVLVGVGTWSGLDTLAARRDFDASPLRTQADKDAGLSKQRRTNLLFGAAAVTGLVTTGLAIFAVNWQGKDTESTAGVRLLVGPGSLAVAGGF
jgi:hypothetical protein